jgi:hypothetical protein
MARAQIETPDGVSVRLEGTPAEIAAVLKEVTAKAKAGGREKVSAKGNGGKVTIPSLVQDLKNEGFFKKTKSLGDIQRRLGELGYHYPLTTLSGAMQGEVKRRRLRRFKQAGKYVYAQ